MLISPDDNKSFLKSIANQFEYPPIVYRHINKALHRIGKATFCKTQTLKSDQVRILAKLKDLRDEYVWKDDLQSIVLEILSQAYERKIVVINSDSTPESQRTSECDIVLVQCDDRPHFDSIERT